MHHESGFLIQRHALKCPLQKPEKEFAFGGGFLSSGLCPTTIYPCKSKVANSKYLRLRSFTVALIHRWLAGKGVVDFLLYKTSTTDLLSYSSLLVSQHVPIWGFPKIRGTILGVPIIRTIVFWGLYWGPLILGNYHMSP